jgi:2-methylcitrate dehydratase PrpD
MLDGAGVAWLAADIAFKPYACGTMAHPYIDCARKLVAEGVSPEEVIAIECKTAEGIVHRLWEPLAAKQHPPNGYAAKFSIPYAIAVGMLRDDAGLDEYEDAVVHDRAIRRLRARCATSSIRTIPIPANSPATYASPSPPAKCAKRFRAIFAADATNQCHRGPRG